MVIDALGGEEEYGGKLNSITSVTLDGVTVIGDDAFKYCNSLTSISAPEVERIGASSFQVCSGLTTVYIPNAKSIGANAFANCSSLTKVDARSVESIDESAFIECTALRHLALPTDAIKTTNGIAFGSQAFAGVATKNGENKLTIYYEGCDTGKDESAQDDFVEELGEAGLRLHALPVPGYEKVEVNFDLLDSFPSAQQDKQLTGNTLARTILNLF